MTGSAIPAIIDALITTLDAALPGVEVIDGMGATDTGAQRLLFVGLSDPDADRPAEAAASDQAWAWLGHMQRDETATVHLVAVAWNGDGDQKRARDEAFGIVDAVAAAITTDPTLGGVVVQVRAVEGLSLTQAQTDAGALAYVPVSLSCRARLS